MRVRSETRRRAATLVEGVIVFLVFLTLVLGMVDLGVAVFRQHLLSEAAREGARQAIVHGSLAAALGPWGPAPLGPVPASDGSPLAGAVRPCLAGMDPGEVTLQAEWLDGGNDPGQRVRVCVSTSHRLLLPALWGGPASIALTASSTMPIAH